MNRISPLQFAIAMTMTFLLLYVLCALTDSVFYRVMPQSFYFFLVLGLAVLVGRRVGGAPSAGIALR